MVSTHSRPKAAGKGLAARQSLLGVSTHSRPKAAGWKVCNTFFFENVSTHSRPKAAGRLLRFLTFKERCFNTQPPEGGWGHFELRRR